MEKTILKIGLCCIALAITTTGQAQKTKTHFSKAVHDKHNIVPCASTEYDVYLAKKYPNKPSVENFEKWFAPKVELMKKKMYMKNTHSVVTIPVVFHVIHNGDAIGTDENINDEQLLSQLQVLNEDFRRILGTPGYNNHPDGADVEIEFCLAQRTPNDEPSTGINHIDLGMQSWDSFEEIDMILKAETQWDPEKYLNIWVCKMEGDLQQVGGYAYFPEGSGLEGLEGSESTADIDGVVLSYEGIGSSDIYPEGSYYPGRDKGRSATHEVGHFLGLRHIWGDDGGCNATDYCNDTPPAADLNFYCEVTDSCQEDDNPDMIENHMDYTEDYCKNIFTNDQKARMWTALENSPRRNALINSDGCVYPEEFDWDGSLKINEFDVACTTAFTTSIELKNRGTNTITSAVITYRIDNTAPQTYNWTGSLAQNAFEEVTINLNAQPGNHTLHVNVTSLNGNADQYSNNDIKSKNFKMPGSYETEEVSLTLLADAFGSEITWTLEDSNENIVYSGGPYEDFDDTPILETFTLADGCYTFTIEDAFGDGICCQAGNGSYTLRTAEGITIATGGAYGFGEKAIFGKTTEPVSAVSDFTATGISIYPNPVKDVLTVGLNENTAGGNYTIYNVLGQNVINGSITQKDFIVNTSALSPGIYIIKIASDNKTKTMRFIKE